MSPIERRQKLLEVIGLRGQDTYDNLASEFCVSKRTIRYDVETLICSYPIETVRGRYGGVRVMDGYTLNFHNSDRRTLTPRQTAALNTALKKLNGQVSSDDLDALNSILLQFAP